MSEQQQQVPPAGGFGTRDRDLHRTSFGPAAPGDTPRTPLDPKPLVTVAVIIVTLSSILVLVVAGCRRYVALARSAEVRVTLKDIAAHAATTYEGRKRLCPSATEAVPADVGAVVPARMYQSRGSDWRVDEERDAGFSCLHVELTMPQYYQYRYTATDRAFTATGRGDLDGDRVLAEFAWTGRVEGGHLVVAPKVLELNDEE